MNHTCSLCLGTAYSAYSPLWKDQKPDFPLCRSRPDNTDEVEPSGMPVQLF
jgi:hypothetical protein